MFGNKFNHTQQLSAMTTPFRLLPVVLFLFTAGSLCAQNFNIAYRSKLSYPGQTCANICGWAGGGHEYALVGASKGLGIVDVTDPDNPVKIVQLPGPDNFWKEIKTYKNHAYVTSEGGQGVQIVDLSGLPSPTPAYHYYTGDGAIAGLVDKIHALHIDTTKGYLYLYGGTQPDGNQLFSGGAVVCDLNTDPYNPVFVGKYDAFGYVHDGWVDNDTLYAAHIGIGLMSIADMTDKSNPAVLGTQPTPNHGTHNTWLTKDRRTVLTTDEVNNSFLAAYDITDPENIQFLDKMQANPGSGSIVHNTHILENYAVTSWYTDGVSIVDVTRPNNLVQTGWYDNAPGQTGGGFFGCWGVYPFLPSGNLIATNIYGSNGSGGGELWVLTPTYKRACYLEGKVTAAADGAPVNNALVEIVSTAAKEETVATGHYTLGQAAPGEVQVKVSKVGFNPVTTTAVLSEGEVTVLDIALDAAPSVSVSGQVLDAGTGLAVPNAQVTVFNNQIAFETTANAGGQFSFPTVFLGTYSVVAGAWGYKYTVKNNQNLNTNQTYTLELDKGYRDDFIFDYGWEVSGTSTEGVWERAEPIGINPGIALAPETDLGGDVGNLCYVTGNSPNVDENDVESGTMILTSPPMDLSTFNDPLLIAFLFFTSITLNEESLDSIRIYADNGIEEQLLRSMSGTTFSWQALNIHIKEKIALTNNMRIRIECFDNPAYLDIDSYEAAFDFFRVAEGNPTGTGEPTLGAILTARPNPFRGQILLEYAAPEAGNYQLNLYDLLGRRVESVSLEGAEGIALAGQSLRPGVYVAQLEKAGLVSKAVKVVKVE